MEGHLAAPGHVAGDTTEEMPSPPFPPRDSPELRAIVAEVMRRFVSGEEPAAAACVAALGWRAGRQAGLDCSAWALETPIRRSRARAARVPASIASTTPAAHDGRPAERAG